MLEELLDEAELAWSDLDAIGVGRGPGNFTGIRIAISAARGLSLSLGIPAVGVDLFDALAEGANGDTLLILDAPRSAHYTQVRKAGGAGEIKIHSTEELAHFPDDLPIIGDRSSEVAEQLNRMARPAAFGSAAAIARIAVRRFRGTVDRPKPLYLRPADAAPPRQSAPRIVP